MIRKNDNHQRSPRFRFPYPKFLLLFISIVLAYIIFRGDRLQPIHDFLQRLGYAGTFCAGILYVYGFTAAPATALLLVLAHNQHPLLAIPLAGAGSVLGDLVIYKIIHDNFGDEVERLKNTRFLRWCRRRIPPALRKYVLPVLGAIFVATPLPDEIGISLLAASPMIKTKYFVYLSFILNTLGIMFVILIGKTI